MASLFEGTPQAASSYVTSTTEMPKWLQDAIYNQIQWSQNLANKPYEAYSAPTVAEFNPLQTQAYNQVSANQGSWQPAMQAAQSGMQGVAASNTAAGLQTAQNQYLNPAMATNSLQQGQNLYGSASGLNAIGAAQPYFNQANANNIVSAANPLMSQAANINIQGAGQNAYNQASNLNTVGAANPYLQASGMESQNITGSANPYLQASGATTSQALSGSSLGVAQPSFNRASTQDISSSANPYLQSANTATSQALTGSSLGVANPYLQSAGKSSVQGIDQYMNPYQQNVLDTIAKQGARNLSENILPGVSDAFIKSGQFGSSRMGEMGSRAIRDTQEAILNAQSTAAQQGYTQALNASQSDLARQAQLASTAGQLSSTDLARVLQGANQYANLGQTAGQLTSQQMQNLINLGQAQGQLSSTDLARALQGASQYASLGQTAGQLAGQQAQNLANIGQTYGSLTGQQQSALTNIGQAQQSAAQQQAAQLASLGLNYGQLTSQQMQNLINLGQTQGQLTSQQQQNLANLGQLQTAAGQVQQQYGLNAAQANQAAQAADYARQLSALQNLATNAQQQQQMGYTDTAALEAAGLSQQALQQKKLDAAKAQYDAEQLYPRQQMDWLSTITRGLAPITPQSTSQSTNTVGQTYSASPLSQLATGLSATAGLSKLLG